MNVLQSPMMKKRRFVEASFGRGIAPTAIATATSDTMPIMNLMIFRITLPLEASVEMSFLSR